MLSPSFFTSLGTGWMRPFLLHLFSKPVTMVTCNISQIIINIILKFLILADWELNMLKRSNFLVKQCNICSWVKCSSSSPACWLALNFWVLSVSFSFLFLYFTFVKQLSSHILFHFGNTAAIFICFFILELMSMFIVFSLSFYMKTMQGRLGWERVTGPKSSGKFPWLRVDKRVGFPGASPMP